MLLYCVRHGESAYNVEGRIQGQSDVPLSGLGHRQSRAVAEALSGLPVEAIYASPLRRAMQTAQPVAERLNLEIRADPRLMEIHAGVFQEKLRSQLVELYPEQFARWKSGDPDCTIPGGESRRDLLRRGREVFEEIGRAGHGVNVGAKETATPASDLRSASQPAVRHRFWPVRPDAD